MGTSTDAERLEKTHTTLTIRETDSDGWQSFVVLSILGIIIGVAAATINRYERVCFDLDERIRLR